MLVAMGVLMVGHSLRLDVLKRRFAILKLVPLGGSLLSSCEGVFRAFLHLSGHFVRSSRRYAHDTEPFTPYLRTNISKASKRAWYSPLNTL